MHHRTGALNEPVPRPIKLGSPPPRPTFMSAKPSAFSLRAQVAWAFGLLVVVLATSLSVVLAARLTQQSEREEGHQLRIVAAHVSQVLSEGVFDRSREVEVLASAESLWRDGIDSVRVSELLARMQARQPHNSWIGAVDMNGVIRAATGGLMVGRDAKERPWFLPGREKTFVGDVHPAKMLASLLPPAASGEPLRFLDFASPILQGGRPVGVLVAHGTWDWAHSVVERLAPEGAREKQFKSFIFDRSGKLIYAPAYSFDAADAAAQQLPLSPADIPAGAHAAVVTWNDGERYLTTAVKVKALSPATDLGWTVVSREPISIAFADAHRSALHALCLGLVVSALAAWLAWVLAGRLVAPLAEIAQAARAVEQGEPGSSIPLLNSSTEVAHLAAALSSMTGRLVQSNNELESRVRERTAELENAVDELHKLARHDPLTGLLNRRGFQERLKSALSLAARRKSALSVVVIDADHFKRINDTHGHDVGDQTLVTIAQTLRDRLRQSDVVARFGGEEFVALLVDTELEGARRVADNLVRAMADVQIPTVGQITVSAGVTPIEVGIDDGSDALRRADMALYRAKSGGRNQAVWLDTAPVPEAA